MWHSQAPVRAVPEASKKHPDETVNLVGMVFNVWIFTFYRYHHKQSTFPLHRMRHTFSYRFQYPFLLQLLFHYIFDIFRFPNIFGNLFD